MSSQERVEAREHVNEIARNYVESSPWVLESLAGALSMAEISFPRESQLILEFMQNAEDAMAKKFELRLDRAKDGKYELVICNDGKPFSKDDVDAICLIGRSRKDPENYLGYLGVGFKSAFLVSDKVQVYSWPYSFKFDKNAWNNPETTPWQIIPIWIEEYPKELREWKTAFILTVQEQHIEPIVRELGTLTSRVLLFTHNLDNISLKWNEKSRSFSKTSTVMKEDGNRQILRIDIEEEVQNYKAEHTSWVVFRSVVEVPEEISKDPITIKWRRGNVRRREIAVAIRLDESGDLSPEAGTVKFGLFSYLPLREEVYDLPFIIHGDFLTGVGRETMNRDAKWNIWLLEEIRKFIMEYVIPAFKSHPDWKYSYTRVLYGNAPHIIEEYLARPLRDEMLYGNHVLDIKEEFVKAEDVITISENLINLLGVEFIQKLTDKHILHPNSKLHSELYNKTTRHSGYIYGIRLKNPYQNVSELVGDYERFKKLQEIFREDWMEHYKKLLALLSHEWTGQSESTRKEMLFEYRRAIDTLGVLSSSGELCSYDQIVLASDDLEREAEERVPGKFKFLHPALRTEKIIRFLESLGTKRLTKEDIEKEYGNKRLPELIKELSNDLTSDEKRVELVRELFNAWRKGYVKLEQLKGIPVKTKSSKWMKPESVVFSDEYQAGYRLEKLTNDGYFDGKLEFLDTVFIKDAKVDEISAWRKFFEEIGVGNDLNRNLSNIAQRVGILVSLHYEKRRGCKPEELTKSVEAGGEGYDIKSETQDGSKIYIEVKATADKERDLNFRRSQYLRLREDPGQYFVYVVTDALLDPKLYVLDGRNLLKLIEEKLLTEVVIRSYDWKSIKSRPDWQPYTADP
jgi:hypothetical protein